MRLAFCTIITPDYMPFTCALQQSIREHLSCPFDFFVFISDSKYHLRQEQLPAGMEFLFIEDVCNAGTGRAIYEKYYHEDKNKFRWSMKPVIMRHLLVDQSFQKVIYSDSDIHYFSNPGFIIDLLDHQAVVLSPHFRSSNPVADYPNYILQFNAGIYNGGFVAAARAGAEALEWWAKNCLAICEIDACTGQFGDQSHLNLLPVFFEGVYILAHRGCNVANWNQLECRRVKQSDGAVLINNSYPIIFIHFTKSTARGILHEKDDALLPYLDKFNTCVGNFSPGFDLATHYVLKDAAESGESASLINGARFSKVLNIIQSWFSKKK